jgi:hypothetical protein
MSALNTCFKSLSTIQSTSYNQLNATKNAWDVFQKVELYNSNISTQHGQGNKNLQYYQYPNSVDQTLYRQGASLFFYYLGYSTIVQKN